MHRPLTDKRVAALKPREKVYTVPDRGVLCGHYVRVHPTGSKTFVAVARNRRKRVWATIGRSDVLTIDEARERARKTIDRIRQGMPPFEEPNTLAASRLQQGALDGGNGSTKFTYLLLVRCLEYGEFHYGPRVHSIRFRTLGAAKEARDWVQQTSDVTATIINDEAV